MKKNMKTPLELFGKDTTTGQLIKAWRKNFEVSQDQMAFACGISQANLSAIENDRRDTGPKVALKLSAFMGLSPEILLYPNGVENEAEYQLVKQRAQKIRSMAV